MCLFLEPLLPNLQLKNSAVNGLSIGKQALFISFILQENEFQSLLVALRMHKHAEFPLICISTRYEPSGQVSFRSLSGSRLA